MRTLLVTGGCGFIGANFVRFSTAHTDFRILNLDALTYAGNLQNISGLDFERHFFVHGDIRDAALVESLLAKEKPWAIVNFAAESHVDRSIIDPWPFQETNIRGVLTLLETVRKHPVSRFLHVSTDEVYGDTSGKPPTAETSPLAPSSPYAATKAASDLICLAYCRTYNVPVIVTRCSNNYGPFQFPEKLIPLLIRNAFSGRELPVYGDGKQVRDWLHVEDHCRALTAVLENGELGSVYNIASGEERANLDVVYQLCECIADIQEIPLQELQERVRLVADRPGHDRRYALDSSKIRNELSWEPRVGFAKGLEETIKWYRAHADWAVGATTRDYQQYYDSVYLRNWGKC
jgi:dTDP-glucose 4,6-dehydratase